MKPSKFRAAPNLKYEELGRGGYVVTLSGMSPARRKDSREIAHGIACVISWVGMLLGVAEGERDVSPVDNEDVYVVADVVPDPSVDIVPVLLTV